MTSLIEGFKYSLAYFFRKGGMEVPPNPAKSIFHKAGEGVSPTTTQENRKQVFLALFAGVLDIFGPFQALFFVSDGRHDIRNENIRSAFF